MILFGLVVALSASCVLICTKILTELLWPFCISKETWPLAMHHRFSSYQLFPPSSSLFPNQTPSLFATLPSPQPLLHIGNLNFYLYFTAISSSLFQLYVTPQLTAKKYSNVLPRYYLLLHLWSINSWHCCKAHHKETASPISPCLKRDHSLSLQPWPVVRSCYLGS